MEKNRINKMDLQSKKLQTVCALLFIITVCLITFNAYALDYPHYEEKGISCISCHFIIDDLLYNRPSWLEHDPQDIDDSIYNKVCWSCHDDFKAPYVRTHSSLQTDDSYGEWSIECRVCHQPHSQKQFRKYKSATHLYTGIVEAVSGSTLTKTDDGMTWDSDEFQSLVLIPNATSSTKKKYGYKILSNTDNTITVSGLINTSKVAPGNTFAVIYGKQINSNIFFDKILTYIGASTDIRPDEPVPGQSMLVENGATWNFDEYAGLELTPTLTDSNYRFTILSNSEDTLTVDGTIEMEETFDEEGEPLTFVMAGDLFSIAKGKTGSADVRFFNSTGANSFADGVGLNDGVCEVCHTNTVYFKSDGSGDDLYHEENVGGSAGSECTVCHRHQDGFSHEGAVGGGGDGSGCSRTDGCHQNQASHGTHLEVFGLSIEDGACLVCHQYNDFPRFVDGALGRENTSVCDNCHSPDGAAIVKDLASDYWSNSGSSYRAPGSWLAVEGEESYCGSCHDGTPGNSDVDGGGNAAADVMGDKINYGFYVTGHGKETGNYARLSSQSVSDLGNPAANLSSCGVCHGIPPVDQNGWPNPPFLTGGQRVTPCSFCHDLTKSHFNSQDKRLRDGFENDQNNTNCKRCHSHDMSEGTAAANAPHFYTTSAEYENSAHKEVLCTGCHNVHGSSGAFPAMTKANKEALCYQCHTEGVVQNDALSNNRTGGHNSADDIQEAFSKSTKHDLGTSFSIGSNNYLIECISCHNVHIVTGKYWSAEEGKSPVTRFTNNLELWGDESGEKMDDYAAKGAGTGGWSYSTARGGVISFDQPAQYRPPKDGGGYGSEFKGDVMPDYTTFCLDCHSSYVGGGTQGAINWSGDPHGLSSANTPGYIADSGTAGFWGSSGNPDVLFQMNYVTRGRHNGHFMRWPYDSADRGAGINFVLSCTDCHEAHGSNRGSMIRERYNVNASGDCGSGGNDPDEASTYGENCSDGGLWNAFCNACHYYYGGQHAGMSCGNASCHEYNSLHRIKKGGGGGGVQLMLTAAGYESEYQKPDFTPEIISIEGHIGNTDLAVTFDNGVWSNMDLSGSLEPDDFWMFDVNGNNPRTIETITHVSGSSTAIITMSEPITEADLSVDTLAMKPASIWQWYSGGYENWATGTIGAQAVSGGPWPVTITGPPPFNVQSVLYGGLQLKLNGKISDTNQIYVTFAEGAYSIIGFDLNVEDFVLNCGGRTILSVTHTAGDSFAILTLDNIVYQSEVGVCTVAANFDSIFDSYGNPAGTAAVTLALPPEASVNDLILRWDFNEGSGTVADSTGTLGTQEDMHGGLTRNVQWVASTTPAAVAGDNAVKLDRVSDRGAVQLNYEVDPDDNFPAKFTNVQEMQQASEFSFSVWIKPTALGCQEGKDLGLNNKLRRDVLTTQFWIKNWALGIMRFSDDGDPLNGNCAAEDSTHDVLRFWVAVGDPTDMRCDPWGGSWPETVYPVSPAGYIQGNYLQPTDQAICDNSANPTLPTNNKKHSFAQTETSASGALTYGGVALQPGVWQHVVGTWDGRYIRIYIDGQLAAETDMGGTGNYVMLADPLLWGGDLVGDGSLFRHVSSGFGVGARPIFSTSGAPSNGAVYWNSNGFYDLNSATYVGELDDVKYWKIALPLAAIQY